MKLVVHYTIAPEQRDAARVVRVGLGREQAHEEALAAVLAVRVERLDRDRVLRACL